MQKFTCNDTLCLNQELIKDCRIRLQNKNYNLKQRLHAQVLVERFIIELDFNALDKSKQKVSYWMTQEFPDLVM